MHSAGPAPNFHPDRLAERIAGESTDGVFSGRISDGDGTTSRLILPASTGFYVLENVPLCCHFHICPWLRLRAFAILHVMVTMLWLVAFAKDPCPRMTLSLSFTETLVFIMLRIWATTKNAAEVGEFWLLLCTEYRAVGNRNDTRTLGLLKMGARGQFGWRRNARAHLSRMETQLRNESAH